MTKQARTPARPRLRRTGTGPPGQPETAPLQQEAAGANVVGVVPDEPPGSEAPPPRAAEAGADGAPAQSQPSRASTGAAPATADPLAAEADAFDNVKAAVNADAASLSPLWISFLVFGTYLAIAFGSVSHRQLFLEEPVTLPVLNVDLPLVAFFVIAPFLFLVFHAYLLLNLSMMADDARRYGEVLRKWTGDADVERHLRQQLPNFIFLRVIAGPRRHRGSATDWLLVAITWLTVVVGPLLLLLFAQLQFLPYHNEPASWAQRGTVVAEVVLLWWFWPEILHGIGLGARVKTAARVVAGVASALLVVFSLLVATFPGEAVRETGIAAEATAFLFEGETNEVTGRPISWFSNRLVLPDQDFVDDEQLARIRSRQIEEKQRPWQSERTRSLRGRDLREAVLVRADLRRADLTGALLEGANLEAARLEGARLTCAAVGSDGSEGCTQLQDAYLVNARLDGALLDGAQLQGALLLEAQLRESSLAFAGLQRAELSLAQLQGASLDYANLREAILDEANLQGASLRGADLQGANLEKAQVQGAALWEAQLRGSSLDYTDLRGALLDGAELQGVSLASADLQGASLSRTQLQGAWMAFADLEGAFVSWAQLTGAFLTGWGLDGTRFADTVLWRTEMDEEGSPLVIRPRADPVVLSVNGSTLQSDPLTEVVARELIAGWVASIPGGAGKGLAETLFQKLTGPEDEQGKDKRIAEVWLELAKKYETETLLAAAEAAHAEAFRREIRTYACKGGPDEAIAIKGMLREPDEGWRFGAVPTRERPGAGKLASDLLACPVKAHLDQETIAALERIAGERLATNPEPDAR